MGVSDINIYSGAEDLSSTGTRAPVDKIIVHGGYSAKTHDNDVALLHVAGTLVGKPIALAAEADEASVSKPSSGQALTITGWGKTETGRPSSILRVASPPLVSREKCNSPASYDGAITDTMICAGTDQGGLNSCQGDSGGPGVLDGKLVGIVSWGIGCGKPYKYGVYANVAKLSGWINA